MKKMLSALTPSRSSGPKAAQAAEPLLPSASPSPRNAIAKREISRLTDSREFFERILRMDVKSSTVEEFVNSLQDGKFLLRAVLHVAGESGDILNKLAPLGDPGVSAENFDKLHKVCNAMQMRTAVTLSDVQAYNVSKIALFFDELKGKLYARDRDDVSSARTPRRFTRSMAASSPFDTNRAVNYRGACGLRRTPVRGAAGSGAGAGAASTMADGGTDPVGIAVLLPGRQHTRTPGGTAATGDDVAAEDVLRGIANVEEKKTMKVEQDGLRQKITQLQEELASATATTTDLQARNQQLEALSETQAARIDDLTEQLQGATHKFSGNMSDMTTALGRSEARCAKMETEVEEYKRRLECEVQKWKKVVDDKIMKENSLRKGAEEGREASEQLVSAQATIASLTARVAELEAQPAPSTGGVSEEAHAEVVNRIDNLTQQCDEALSQLQLLQAAHDKLQTEHTAAKAELAAAADERARQGAVRQAMASCREALVTCRAGVTDVGAAVKHEFTAAAADFQSAGAQLVLALRQVSSDAEAANARYLREAKERRRVHNLLAEAKGNIRVFCRVRPASAAELETADAALHATSETDLMVTAGLRDGDKSSRRSAEQSFEFDRVFGPDSTQQQVFEEVEGMAVSALDGYHSCIFAYGQTGAGKTYTMMGPAHDRGVNHRTLDAMFREAGDRGDSVAYTFAVSFVEIYNETVKDLLASGEAGTAATVDVRQGPTGVYMPGVVTAEVACAEEVQDVMRRGEKARSVGTTNCNERSSRSHSLLIVNVAGRNKVSGAASRGRLVLVDLAGSERVSKSGVQGARMKETQAINKSLAALGNVIAALVSGSSHVPFRDSKLTYLLQDSLGKDNKTLMIAQLNPMSRGESVCTLNFATRVRRVELGKARSHKDSDEMARLRTALTRAREDSRSCATRLVAADEQVQQARAAQQAAEAAAAAAAAKVKAAEKAAATRSDSVSAKVSALQAQVRSQSEELAALKTKASQASKAHKSAVQALKAEKEAMASEAAVEQRRLQKAADKAKQEAVERAVDEVRREAQDMLARRRREARAATPSAPAAKAAKVAAPPAPPVRVTSPPPASPVRPQAKPARVAAPPVPATPPRQPSTPHQLPATPIVSPMPEGDGATPGKAGDAAGAAVFVAAKRHKATPFRPVAASRLMDDDDDDDDEEWTSGVEALNTVLFAPAAGDDGGAPALSATAPVPAASSRRASHAPSPKPAGILKASSSTSRFQSIRNASVIVSSSVLSGRGKAANTTAAPKPSDKSVTFASPLMSKCGTPVRRGPRHAPPTQDENRPVTAPPRTGTPGAAKKAGAPATRRPRQRPSALGLPARVATASRRTKHAARITGSSSSSSSSKGTTGGWRF